MNSFEELPENIRALLRVKLVMEIASNKCKNLSDLAQQRGKNVTRVWRDICRKAGQPDCKIPIDMITGKDS